MWMQNACAPSLVGVALLVLDICSFSLSFNFGQNVHGLEGQKQTKF